MARLVSLAVGIATLIVSNSNPTFPALACPFIVACFWYAATGRLSDSAETDDANHG